VSLAAVILYEDARGPEKGFGLHALVLACVADELGAEMFSLAKRLDGRPLNGVTNLLQSCRRTSLLAPRGQKVFAVIDEDHVRDHLPGMDPRAEEEVVVRAIKGQSDAPMQLEIILLKKNTETVIEAAKHCDDRLPAAAVEQALRKHLAQRDRILNNVARAGSRAVRDCIRAKVPALERLVTSLRDVVSSASAL
jgi:hypothetical protein